MATLFAFDDATFDSALAAALLTPEKDTILVSANQYTQFHTIGTDVAVVGPKAGQPGDGNLRGTSEANFTAGLQITGNDVSVSGIEISGLNQISGGFETGLRVDGANVVVSNTLFAGVTGSLGPSVGLTLAGTNTAVTNNAFLGYDEGVFGVGASSANIVSNHFEGTFGIFTESTNLVASQNIFSDLQADFFSNPSVSNNLSTQFLADNVVSTLNPFKDVQIIPQSGATNITGTVFDDAFSGDFGPAQAYVFLGLGGNDFAAGNSLGDLLDGGDGNDSLFGNAGGDILIGGSGNNALDGGAGTDTANYSGAPTGINVNLLAGGGSNGFGGTDAFTSIENITGSGFDDRIAGNGGPNTLDGAGGSDTIVYSAASGPSIIDLAGNVGVSGGDVDALLNFENAIGSAFNDSISGTAATNTLDGAGGVDTVSYYLTGRGVNIDLAAGVAYDGTSFDTLLNFENANGSSFNDALSGTAGANVLNGLAGVDTVSYYLASQGVTINLGAGTANDGTSIDTLLNLENANGSSHNDTLIGDGGNNVLNGLGGIDVLTGAGGNDTFVFISGQANGDTVTDFAGNGAAAGDTLRFVGFGTTAEGATFTQLDATHFQVHSGLDGHNEVIDFANAPAVHPSDILFV